MNAADAAANTARTNASADTIGTTHTDTIEIKVPGFLTRMKKRFEENPIKTSIAGALAIGAGAVGTVNYRNHGSPMPIGVRTNEAGEVVAAVAAMFR